MIYITIIFFIILNVVEMTRVGSEKLSWQLQFSCDACSFQKFGSLFFSHLKKEIKTYSAKKMYQGWRQKHLRGYKRF